MIYQLSGRKTGKTRCSQIETLREDFSLFKKTIGKMYKELIFT